MLILQKILAIENVVKSFFGRNYIIAIKNHFHTGYEFSNKNQFLFSRKKIKFLASKDLIEIRFLCGLDLIAKTHDVPFFLNACFSQTFSPVFSVIPYYYDRLSINDEYCVGYNCQFEIKMRISQNTEKIDIFFLEYTQFKEKKSLKNLINTVLKQHLEQSLGHGTKKKFKNRQTWMLPKESILQSIKTIISHMQKGDAYLVNMTHTQVVKEKNDITFDSSYFLHKWFFSQSTFGFYLDTPEIGMMSFSPERFLIKRGDLIVTQPIKGTEKSGDPSLWQKTKEMYEHTMVVDLLRNDLNAICIPGSVVVTHPFFIKKAATILHMESTICGKVENFNPQMLLKLLPGGSITGTPKKKTCELIQQYELNGRGYYTGIAGIIEKPVSKHVLTFERNFDFSILIRSVFRGRDKVYIGVGAGITTLSHPLHEFEEFCLKLKSFL